MADFERGWYVSLLIEAADNSERPGWLANDMSVLWTKAGAKTMAYFQREGRSVLACFNVRTDDGRWISNPKLLKTIENKTTYVISKNRGYRGLDVGFKSLNPQLQKLFEESYGKYPRKVGIRAAQKAFAGAVKRHKSVSNFGELIVRKVAEYAQTPAGQNGKFTPHMSTWLNQDRFLDDPREWLNGEEPATPGADCKLHPGAGITAKGNCWECAKIRNEQRGQRL